MGKKMDDKNENEIRSEKKESAAHSDGYNAAHKNSFAQRNKYRIRQVCGVIALAVVLGGSVVVLAKCSGNDISDADSAIEVARQSSDGTQTEASALDDPSSLSDTQTETMTQTQQSSTSDTPATSEQTSQTTQETSDTDEQTTTQQTTETTVKTTAKTTAKQTTASQQTTRKTTVSKQTTKQTATEPVGPADVEKKSGLTYVNGILIANKTYPLPSSYVPNVVPVGNYQYLDPNAAAAFTKMQKAAAAEGINLFVCSGYRSYSYQQYLYNNYVAMDGKAAADRYSARPGHSEHQTGLAADINMASSYFDNTVEAKWLAKHCTDYGFIIRYKAGKESSTGYMAESWHIRYLGDINLCKSIEASGLSLEEYLGITSKYSY